MKNRIYIGIALFALAAAAFFSVLTGRQFLELVSGPMAVTEGLDLGQAEGQYIVYSVTRPAASFPEEYYSGDPDRVSRMAYVVYDEERQLFIKVVVADRKVSSFDRLLRAANKAEEGKADAGNSRTTGESPMEVSGSLVSVTDDFVINEIKDALMQGKSESNEEMNRRAMEQKDWYVLEDGKVQGFPVLNLWLCAVTIIWNVLVILVCLISMMKKGKISSGSGNDGMDFRSDSMDRMLDRQRAWLNPWCMKGRARRTWTGILFLLGAAAALTALGFAVGYTAMGVLTRHLPIGLCIGELCGFPILMGMGLAFDPDKILKACRKNLIKAVPSQAERNALAEDLLGTEPQWAVLETDKEQARYGILGERYWLVFSGDGSVAAVNVDRMESIETKEVCGQIRTGRVRMNYTRYEIRIRYRNSERKSGYDTAFNFLEGDTAGHFMMLARKRLGDRAAEVIK